MVQLVLAAAAGMWSASCGAAGPEVVERSLVSVDVVSVGEKPRREVTGVVLEGGWVLVPLSTVEEAAEVWVRTADEHRHEAIGVVAYHDAENIVLISVAWEGDAPAGAAVGDGFPEVGSVVELRAGPHAGLALAEVTVGSVELDDERVTTPAGDDPRAWAGAVMVDGKEQVVGITTGFGLLIRGGNLGTGAPPVGAGTSFTVALAPTISTLEAGEVVAWEAWRARAQALKTAKELAEEAVRAQMVGEYGEARRLARESLGLDERNGLAWAALGAASLRSGSYAEAAEAAGRALTLRPRDVRSRRLLITALAKAERREEAVAEARRYLAMEPTSADAHAMLGWALHAAKRAEEALEAYEAALRLDSDNKVAAHGTAQIREYLAAVEQWERRDADEPGEPK